MPSPMLLNLLQPAEGISKLRSILPALPKTSSTTETAERPPSLPCELLKSFPGTILLKESASSHLALLTTSAPPGVAIFMPRHYLHTSTRNRMTPKGPLNQQRRLFFSFGRRGVEKLEQNADAAPADARKQAVLYRALIDSEPQIVIQRFEDSRFARDEECASIYLAALYETNQLERATRFLLAEPTPVNGGNGGGGPTWNFGTKDRPIYVSNVQNGGSLWRRFFSFVNVMLVGLVAYNLMGGPEGKLGGLSNKAHKFFQKDTAEKTYTFDDVQGCDEAKRELEEVVEFLKNPAKFNKLGAKMPKGILLVGPPGTGKTLLAKAIAGEADVPFIYASGSQFEEVFVGMGSSRIRQMFKSAKEQAPAIIFIDEIDAVGSKRNPRDPQYARMSLNQLLTEMDGFAETTGVIVIAATNLPESLDKALLRPGRFDRHVHVPLPDIRGRKQILDMYLKDVMTSPDVDTQVIARATPGFSGAELFKMVNQAKISASVENGLHVAMSHLEHAKDDIILGAERKSQVIAEEDKRLTAFHEAGHAVVAHYSKYAYPIHKATIIPRGMALGMVSQLPEKDELSVSKVQLLARMDVAMGGRVAEHLIFGEDHVTTGASSDFEQANAIAKAMVTKYGMSEKLGSLVIADDEWDTISPQTREIIDSEVKRLLEESRIRARQIIQSNRSILDKIALALIEYETLTKEEIENLIAGKPLRPDPPARSDVVPSLVKTPKFDLLY